MISPGTVCALVSRRLRKTTCASSPPSPPSVLQYCPPDTVTVEEDTNGTSKQK